jgi:hypothetical protein
MSSVTSNGITYIPSLLHKRYGIKIPGVYGVCLAIHVAYSVNVQTGISIKRIEQAFRKAKLSAGSRGLTLEQCCWALERSLPVRFDAIRLPNVIAAMDVIRIGRPPIVVVDSYSSAMPSGANWEGIIGNAYVSGSSPVDGNDWGPKHAMMAIGFDAPAKMLIIRESRHTYDGCDGYAKVSIPALRQHSRTYGFIDLVAHLTKPVRKGTIPSL